MKAEPSKKAMASRVVIADDHAVFRKGLKGLIENEPPFEVVGEAGTGLEALQVVRDQRPDLLLLDISMPALTGPRVADVLLEEFPDLLVIVLTMHEDEHYMKELMAVGAKAFVLKHSDPEVLIHAMNECRWGRTFVDPHFKHLIAKGSASASEMKDQLSTLSRREREVLGQLAHGLTNQEIADHFHLSRRTVENHRASLISKLGLRSRTELVRFARDHGLMEEFH